MNISNGRLGEVNIENLPYLKYLRLKSHLVERITLASLNALKSLILNISQLKTSLQTDFCNQILSPNIVNIDLNGSSTYLSKLEHLGK